MERILIYGGGLQCYYFLNEKSSKVEHEPITVVGIIDDAPALWGQYVYGYKVLGSADILECIYETVQFDKLIISSPRISEKGREVAIQFCDKHKLKVVELVSEEVVLSNTT